MLTHAAVEVIALTFNSDSTLLVTGDACARCCVTARSCADRERLVTAIFQRDLAELSTIEPLTVLRLPQHLNDGWQGWDAER